MGATAGSKARSNAYEFFILVLTVYSLAIMVGLVLPLSDQTKVLLTTYDNLICVVFLLDFVKRLRAAPAWRDYVIGERGWLDLLGSVPSLGFFRLTGLLRLARLSRLARISKLVRGAKRKELIADVVENRGRYAAFVTVLAALLVLTLAGVLVLQFESTDPGANITSGGSSLWWSVVTLTTVGYGDHYPITVAGQITATFVMFAGVGIIGALASILASVLVPSPSDDDEQDQADGAAIRQELALIRRELAELRAHLGASPPSTT